MRPVEKAVCICSWQRERCPHGWTKRGWGPLLLASGKEEGEASGSKSFAVYRKGEWGKRRKDAVKEKKTQQSY